MQIFDVMFDGTLTVFNHIRNDVLSIQPTNQADKGIDFTVDHHVWWASLM